MRKRSPDVTRAMPDGRKRRHARRVAIADADGGSPVSRRRAPATRLAVTLFIIGVSAGREASEGMTIAR